MDRPRVIDLAPVVREAFGAGCRLERVDRLRGGTKKGVYRLALSAGPDVIAYVWHPEESYWPASVEPPGPFDDASGLALFERAQRTLAALQVRTPRVLHVSEPHQVALVEDVPGPRLEDAMRPDALRRLAAAVRRMHRHRSASFGKLGLPQSGVPEQIVLERALRHLDEAAALVPAIAAVRDRAADRLRALREPIAARDSYALIHGELGPDHVLVDAAGEPVLIDIEGLMFFDPEWEHVFLRLRFGRDYHWLAGGDLDQRRMRLYALATHLSLVAGPLRLVGGDFPEQDFMLDIARHHEREVLRLLAG
jgi:Phosphotransferase enzyme family